MAKKEEKICQPCKWSMLICSIIFIGLGVWVWMNPTIQGLARAIAVAFILIGVKKLGNFCPCRSGPRSS